MTDSGARPRFGARAAAAFVALVLLAFAPAWPGGFLVEDWTYLARYREWTVAQTVKYELGLPLRDRAWVEAHRPDFFTAALWRPLPYILAHLEQRAFDGRPAGWFALRLACHTLTAWLFACAVLAWTGRRRLGWIAGLLFALHPSRYFPLLVVSQSQMLLASLGAVLALWGLGVWREGRARAGATATVAGAVFACWSYEQALPLLVAWPVLDLLWPTRAGGRPAVRAVLRRGATLAIVVAVYVGWRLLRFEGFGGYTTIEGGERVFSLSAPLAMLAGALETAWYTLLSLIAPVSMQDWNLDAPLGAPADPVAATLNGVLALASLGLIVYRARGRWRALALGTVALGAFTFWAALPVAGLLDHHEAWHRYIYFPGFAWVLALAWALTPEAPARRAQWAPAAFALVLALPGAWWGVHVFKTAWRQTHGLHDALAEALPPDRTAYVYLRGFREWIGGRNLFIRSLQGPIDVGLDPARVRVWPDAWQVPASVPMPLRSAWPFARPPFVRAGAWDFDAATLTLREPAAYRPGAPGARRTWDLTTHSGRRAWQPGGFMTPVGPQGDGLQLVVESPFALITGPPLRDLAWTPAVLELEMASQTRAGGDDWVEVLFYTRDQPTAAASHILRARVEADGRPHRYFISLLDHPAPVMDAPVRQIALRPTRFAGTVVLLRSIGLAAAAAGPPPAP